MRKLLLATSVLISAGVFSAPAEATTLVEWFQSKVNNNNGVRVISSNDNKKTTQCKTRKCKAKLAEFKKKKKKVAKKQPVVRYVNNFTSGKDDVIEPNTYVKVDSNNKIISLADNYVGYSEKRNRNELRKKLNIDPVRTPWCAGFVNYVLESTGYRSTDSLLASSYSNYGKKVTSPSSGDIVLLKRDGGSGRHVGFFYGYVKENGVKYVVVLGGNQNGTVSIKKYPASIIVGFRKPVKKNFA